MLYDKKQYGLSIGKEIADLLAVEDEEKARNQTFRFHNHRGIAEIA